MRTPLLLLLFALLPAIARSGTFTQIENFGDNPAALQMIVYLPDRLPDSPALVVALHGCTQDARTYADAGWRELADELQFVLLLPEQSVAARWINSCWNWSRAEDSLRDRGEVRSIVSMVQQLRQRRGIDARRIFVDGLSAGGWLASELLVAYPELFAGGATHAGGPAYCAAIERPWWDVFGNWTLWRATGAASQCMRGVQRSGTEWAALARAQRPRGAVARWPILSIWHGDDDGVVHPANQRELLEQWSALHGIDEQPERTEIIAGDTRAHHAQYGDRNGRIVLETWRIEDMTHGVAIDASPGEHCGEPSAFVLDVGICAARHISRFWGLDRR